MKIKCVGTNSNKSAIGAIVQITAMVNGNLTTQTRKVEASSGYASQNSLTTHFGLGNASEILEVKIKWPSGLIEKLSELSINSTHNLVEGTGTMAIIENSPNTIKIFPNPVKNNLNLEGLPVNCSCKFVLLNSEGKLIYSENIKGKTRINFDVSNIDSGVYLYQILDNQQRIQSGKLIKI